MAKENDELFKEVLSSLNLFRFMGKQIPSYMHEGLAKYIAYGIQPGQFLYCILSNNLKEAIHAADSTNLWIVPVYVAYLYNEAPSHSYGSENIMIKYMEAKRASETEQVSTI
jgi:hypothetical protein